jgi:hypothetical protein
MLSENTMTPVAHAAYNLHAAASVRRARITFLDLFTGLNMEALAEAPSHLVPLLTMGMTYDRLVRRDLDVVRQGKPVVTSAQICVGKSDSTLTRGTNSS